MNVFKLLTKGASFDKNRFAQDAIKLKLKNADQSNPIDGVESKRLKLDEIGNGHSSSSTANGIGEATMSAKALKEMTPEEKRLHVKRIRRANRIHIWGTDLPDPIQDFSSIKQMQDSPLPQNLKASGYNEPTPVQMQAIPILLQERELLACAPTGSGKTLSFLVPLIIKLKKPGNVGFRAVIVVPSLELALQIHRDCVRLCEGIGLKSFMIDKTDVASEKFKTLTKCDILVTTPNRLVHLVKADGISLKNVQNLIIDECDRLFETGFREQLGFIYASCDSANIRRAFFSATCTYDVEEFCKSYLDNPVIMYIGAKNSAVETIQQKLEFTGSELGKLTAFNNLIREGIEPPVLVFVQSQARADELYLEMKDQGLKIQCIHAGKTKGQREHIINEFRHGNIWILICTTVLSRGVDFPAVKLVVNYDLPLSPIEYIHSVGRTGRAGRTGKAVTFFTEDDRDNLRRIAQVLENSGFPVPPYIQQLPKLRKDKKSKQKLQVPKRNHILSRVKFESEKKKKRMKMIKQGRFKKDNEDKNESASTTKKPKLTKSDTKSVQKDKANKKGGSSDKSSKKNENKTSPAKKKASNKDAAASGKAKNPKLLKKNLRGTESLLKKHKLKQKLASKKTK